jgi:hypothetical protein
MQTEEQHQQDSSAPEPADDLNKLEEVVSIRTSFAAQIESAKIIYPPDAGSNRKIKYYWEPDNEMVDSKRINSNAIFDKDHFDSKRMRGDMKDMETQSRPGAQVEDLNGNLRNDGVIHNARLLSTMATSPVSYTLKLPDALSRSQRTLLHAFQREMYMREREAYYDAHINKIQKYYFESDDEDLPELID